jgi:formate hydrogenlyase subunit 6/NADH:ubiquinone oxidoreductase subunit I
MNILILLSRTLVHRRATLRYPQRLAPTGEFRGMVLINPAKCLACGICDYVCISAAITVTSGDLDCVWQHDPGKCTFCGRCVENCPGLALRHEGDKAPLYEHGGELRAREVIPYPACPRCGKPARPFDERLLARAFGEVNDELRRRVHLCAHCRQREAQAAFKKGLSGERAAPAVDTAAGAMMDGQEGDGDG